MRSDSWRPPATVVLVHGIFHGSWCWDPLVLALAKREIPVRAIDRRRGEPKRVISSLRDNDALVRECLDAVGGPVILVGHSYGCRVITQAGTHPDVRHLVYIAGVMPDGPGDPLIPAPKLPQPVVFADDGSLGVDPGVARASFFTEVDDELADWAVARLSPQEVPYPDPEDQADVVAWRHRPSTYVVCTRDATVAPDLQRTMSERAANRASFDSGHSPFLSHPNELADLLATLARTA